MNKLSPHIINVVEKMMQCRETDGLGYNTYVCPDHPDERRVVPYTCKTRICSCCAKIQNDIWGEQMKQQFPIGQYFHVTFTMPQEFREFFGEQDSDWKRRSDLYQIAWKVLRGYYEYQHNIQTGCLIVLHTFGRALNINPHLHIVIPAGGLMSLKGQYQWKRLKYIAREYLQETWKNNLLEYVLQHTPTLQQHAQQIIQCLNGDSTENYKQLLRIIKNNAPKEEHDMWMKVLSINYYVNASKRSSYQQTVCYVARYTRRLPVSKSKIIAYDQDNQTVTWRYHPHNQPTPVQTTLHTHDFIDRMIQHIPPKNFRLVRYVGIFATKNKKKFSPLLKKLSRFDPPKRIPTWRERQLQYTKQDPLQCPCCKKDMILIERVVKNQATSQFEVYTLKKT